MEIHMRLQSWSGLVVAKHKERLQIGLELRGKNYVESVLSGHACALRRWFRPCEISHVSHHWRSSSECVNISQLCRLLHNHCSEAFASESSQANVQSLLLVPRLKIISPATWTHHVSMGADRLMASLIFSTAMSFSPRTCSSVDSPCCVEGLLEEWASQVMQCSTSDDAEEKTWKQDSMWSFETVLLVYMSTACDWRTLLTRLS